jgi:hypothetical protein
MWIGHVTCRRQSSRYKELRRVFEHLSVDNRHRHRGATSPHIVCTRLNAEARFSQLEHPVDLLACQTVSFKHLVFGKAVRFRHYPVTVNAERPALCSKPLGL